MHLALFLVFLAALAAGEKLYGADPNVLELTPATFDEVVYRSNYTTIVKFYAPWCGYCKQLEPVYRRLAKFVTQDAQYAVNVASVNCHEKSNSALCAKHRVDAYPTLVVFRPPKYDDISPPAKPLKASHVTERYAGQRELKPMLEFLTNRIKNYVKKTTSAASAVFKEFVDIDRRFKAVLVTESRNLSPMYKSLAIDYLGDIKFGMISTKDRPVAIAEWGVTVDALPALVLHDSETNTTVQFEGKLKDKAKITEWLIEHTGIRPQEGALSDKEKDRLSYFRRNKRAPKKKKTKTQSHDEL